MPFDSNGVFTRVMNWTSDQQNGIAIECGRHDQEDDNFAEGFNDTYCRDGRAAATGDFNLGSHKIKNLANGTVSTDAVNKGQLDTGLSAKANDNAVVKLTGNQDVSGIKLFFDSIYQRVDTIRGQAPGTAQFKDIGFVDKNNKWLAGLEYSNGTNKGSALTILLADSVNDSTNMATYLELAIDENSNTYARVPASDLDGTIVTTVAKSRGQNGFYQLGNGLIINWGTLSSGKTITFSKAFTNANSYALVFNNNSTTDGYGRGDKIESKSSTNATVNGLCENPIYWLAIGY